ncbi:MAG: rRNA maturation RNase YbeY [Lachnospiraceae bacterium]|nr:rRNA maturation RNase YbeY [Lachnospiraceae bacterium]
MNISIENESGLNYPEEFNQIISRIVNASVDFLKCPYECQVAVTLVNDEQIHEINLENRNIDRATDVLSFPMMDFDQPNDLSLVEANPQDYFDPESGELLMGDIVISLEHVSAQAKEYNHSERREIAFLTAHSCLHLFGYDHMTDEERLEMEKLQEEILQKEGFTRDA